MSQNHMRILLVEDDVSTRDAIASYLERENCLVTQVGDGQSALAKLSDHLYDLVILDLMLPNVSGERVCGIVRQTSSIPIIVLTGKANIDDKVMAFDLGVDDYMVKPFSPRELVARAKALVRRSCDKVTNNGDVRHFGDLEINFTSRKVRVRDKEVILTSSEFDLLSNLSASAGKAFSRMELVERVLGYDFEGYERTIDSHIKNLRQKISDDPKNPKWIHTVHGVGYRFEYVDGQ